MLSYKEMFPDYNDPDSKKSDKYIKIVIEAKVVRVIILKKKKQKLLEIYLKK